MRVMDNSVGMSVVKVGHGAQVGAGGRVARAEVER